MSSRWTLIGGKSLCVLLCEGLSDLQAMWGLGLAHGVTLCVTLLSRAVCNPCLGKSSAAASLLLGVSVFEMHQTTLLASCVFCVWSWESGTTVLSSICRVLCIPVKSRAQGDLSASRHFVWSDNPGNTNCCVKPYTLGQLRCLSSRQAKSYEVWLGKSFLCSVLSWYLPQTGAIHWDTWATHTARSAQPCCQDSYLTTW